MNEAEGVGWALERDVGKTNVDEGESGDELGRDALRFKVTGDVGDRDEVARVNF